MVITKRVKIAVTLVLLVVLTLFCVFMDLSWVSAALG